MTPDDARTGLRPAGTGPDAWQERPRTRRDVAERALLDDLVDRARAARDFAVGLVDRAARARRCSSATGSGPAGREMP